MTWISAGKVLMYSSIVMKGFLSVICLSPSLSGYSASQLDCLPSDSGKLAQYSDKNERGRPLCPNIHPNFSWMKVRTDFHGLTFCRRAGHFSRESCNTGFHLLLSSVSFGSG